MWKEVFYFGYHILLCVSLFFLGLGYYKKMFVFSLYGMIFSAISFIFIVLYFIELNKEKENEKE